MKGFMERRRMRLEGINDISRPDPVTIQNK
jgi:hypothetical protein